MNTRKLVSRSVLGTSGRTPAPRSCGLSGERSSPPRRRSSGSPRPLAERERGGQSAKLDTHYYDGKLRTNRLLQIVHNQQRLPIEDKKTFFTRLLQDLELNPAVPGLYRSTALRAVKQITRGIRQAPNYDGSNGMYADDVLYLVCKKIEETKNTDALVYLSEQLSDIMTSGQCAQGRSTRIFQVLMALECSPDKEAGQDPSDKEADPPPADESPDKPHRSDN